MSKDTAQAINFIRQEDGDLDALMLAACLTALGIPFSERPAFSVRGDTQPVVNWLFDESSPDGKHRASECIARLEKLGGEIEAGDVGRYERLCAVYNKLIDLKHKGCRGNAQGGG